MKDLHKSDFQAKLQEELETLRTKTQLEVEQIKRHTKEVYERENR